MERTRGIRRALLTSRELKARGPLRAYTVVSLRGPFVSEDWHKAPSARAAHVTTQFERCDRCQTPIGRHAHSRKRRRRRIVTIRDRGQQLPDVIRQPLSRNAGAGVARAALARRVRSFAIDSSNVQCPVLSALRRPHATDRVLLVQPAAGALWLRATRRAEPSEHTGMPMPAAAERIRGCSSEAEACERIEHVPCVADDMRAVGEKLIGTRSLRTCPPVSSLRLATSQWEDAELNIRLKRENVGDDAHK